MIGGALSTIRLEARRGRPRRLDLLSDLIYGVLAGSSGSAIEAGRCRRWRGARPSPAIRRGDARVLSHRARERGS